MIVVDSSIWIANPRDIDSPQVCALRAIPDPDQIVVGALILLEVLQGAIEDAHAAVSERLGASLAPGWAANVARRTVKAMKNCDICPSPESYRIARGFW